MPDNQNQQSPLEEWPSDGLEYLEGCPVCGCTNRTLLYTDLEDRVFFCAPGRWSLYHCHECTCAYLNPRPTLETLPLAYREYYTHIPIDEFDIQDIPQIPLRKFRHALRNGYLNHNYHYRLHPTNSFGAIAARFFPTNTWREEKNIRHLVFPGQGARLLDIGCGNGQFLSRMKAIGWQVFGVEPDPEAVRHAKEKTADIFIGYLEDAPYTNGFFDAITLNHVLEHLHFPRNYLERCWKLLKPGGIIWIATPNLNSLGHRRFMSSWRGLEVPRHIALYTDTALSCTLKEIGYLVSSPIRTTGLTRWMYEASNAILLGLDPNLEHGVPTRAQNQIIRQDYIKASLWPKLAEELILIGKKTH